MFDNEDWEIWVILGGLGFAFILVGSAAVFTLSALINRFISTTESLGSAIQIVSITISALLTLALVLIYRDIRSLQEDEEDWMAKQTQILSDQQDLTEAQFTPVPSVSFTEDDINEDEIKIHCANSGTGIARGLKLELKVFVGDLDTSDPLHAIEGQYLTPISDVREQEETEVYGAGQEPQRRMAERGFWARATSLRYSDEGEGQRTRSEPLVKPDRDETFISKLQIMEYGGIAADPSQASPISFERATSELLDLGYTVLGYQLKFSYEDILGEQSDPTTLASGFFEISDSGNTFEEIFSNSVGAIGTLAPYRSMEERYVAMVQYP